MSEIYPPDKEFLNRITRIIEENISDEKFGVTELADKIGMSRSNLLRKINKLENISVSQYIRNVRLKHAFDLIQNSDLNITEISYQVGFGSTSYFIKCFRDYYGYPPGEMGKKGLAQKPFEDKFPKNRRRFYLTTIILLVFIGLTLFIYLKFKLQSANNNLREKSIAVLPFKNDSNDSTNVYFINGLMEAVLSNLQKIEDIRVISRTSVEKYRNTQKSIPEIAKELGVNYFVEGSGQKIGDKILLNIQLIEAKSDRHLWAEQYNKETSDVFTMQIEVAKSIASEIKAIITPDEDKRIKVIPTKNMVAYDYFLKGLDEFYKGSREGLEQAIHYMEQAIEHDNKFARAYASIAIAYYYLDFLQAEKKYKDTINYYSDQALLFDPQLAQSLVSKALFYMDAGEFNKAEPYLEKALEFNPNSTFVINILSDFYTSYIPNTAKYLEYALKGIRLDIAANDSSSASFIYLHLANAFVQTGFVNEALNYINKSLEYNPQNLYSEYVKAYILYTKNGDLYETRNLLLAALAKDTTRLDILQEAGKIHYQMRDYKGAYKYYKRFLDISEKDNLDIYWYEDLKIGYVFSQLGLKNESGQLIETYKNRVENDKSIYKPLMKSTYYCYTGELDKALDELKEFAKSDNYHYWIILFFKIDPITEPLTNYPGFKEVWNQVEEKFWKNHADIKARLLDKGLL